MTEIERAKQTQQIIEISLIGLSILFFVFLLFRIIARIVDQKRLKNLVDNAYIDKGIEYFKKYFDNRSFPPLLLFKINAEIGLSLIKQKSSNLLIIETRTMLGYKYYFSDLPFVFVFSAKNKMYFENKINAQFSSEIRFSNYLNRIW